MYILTAQWTKKTKQILTIYLYICSTDSAKAAELSGSQRAPGAEVGMRKEEAGILWVPGSGWEAHSQVRKCRVQ